MRNESRREFLMRAALAGAAAVLGSRRPAAGPTANQKPNVLFLMTDQQTVGALGCAGNPHVKTPNLDSLAAHGARFEKSYCTYPVCSPARASLATSRMPHEMGIYSNSKDPGIPASMTTLGDIFRAAGYETAWSGKWHVPAPYPAFATGARAAIPGFEVLPLEGPEHRSDPNMGPGMGTDPTVAAAAVTFLQQPHETPFLLTVSILNPHDICEYPRAPEHYPKPAVGDTLPPLPSNHAATANEPSIMQTTLERQLKAGTTVGEWGEIEWRTYLWVYYRLTEIADGLIGQVLAALREAGQEQNTIVVFTSDHGEMGGSHKRRTKNCLYEESAAVPLIVCVPGVTEKPVVDSKHLVSGLDILPTLCDLAGVKAPANAAFEGASLRPLIEGKTVTWRDHLVVELGDNSDARMVRTGRYSYIAYATGENREQLFDMEADPGETKNLAGEASAQAALEEHRRLLREWIEKTGDAFGKEVPPALPEDRKAKRAKKGKAEDSGAGTEDEE